MIAIFVIGFLFAPRAAHAQFNSAGADLSTLLAAINGDPTATATINTALGNPASTPTVGDYIAGATAALGGITNANTLLTAAIGGDVPSLNTIQGALSGNYSNPTTYGFFYNSYYDPYYGYYLGVPNVYDNLIAYTVAGTGVQGIQTLVQALSGNAGAIAALGTVLSSPPSMSYSIYTQLLTGNFGGTAATITLLNAVIAGDAAATSQYNTFISSLLSSNNCTLPSCTASGYLSPETRAWITAATPAATGILDTDGDGIPDTIDTDVDGDGVPNQYDTDQNGDGITDNPDTDGDGTPDAVDPTPTGGDPTDATGTQGGTGTGGTGGTGTAGGSTTPPTNDCDSGADAPLTGDFGTDPCALTEETLAMDDDDFKDVAGQQFVDHLNEWWTSEMLPAMKNMTAQWHASVIDQSRQFGSAIDSHNVTKQVKQVQTREIEAKQRMLPNERTCVSATPTAPLANTSATHPNIAAGFQDDVAKRSAGAPGLPSEKGAVIDLKDRLQTYCTQFNDPDANTGVNPCPSPTTAGPLPNGDIDIEGFLFKDTVDLKKPEQYAAAKALLTNLIEPKTPDKLSDDTVDTSAGHEYILKREHMAALRSVAANVVSSMISRRTSIPLPTTAGGATPPPPPPVPPPPPPPAPPVTSGKSAGNYNQFLDALGMRENNGNYKGCNSSGFCGKYQMGRAALVDIGCVTSAGPWPADSHNNYNSYPWIAGNAACGGVTSIAAYQACGPCQESAIRANMVKKKGFIGASTWANGACKTVHGIFVTPSGMLAAAHLVGQGGVKCFIDGTSCGSSMIGKDGYPMDGNKTSIVEYLTKFAGYDTPFGGATCGPGSDPGTPTSTATGAPPPPPKPVGQTIREIRQRAGVPDDEISDNPSYNEIMLAMTKERFFDPDYYVRMANDLNAIKQEQASVKAYISLQLQDIYTLQEQINALMAARASMKIDATGKPTGGEGMPVR